MDKRDRNRFRDLRFKLGYAFLALMLGIGIILNYITNGDIHLVIGIFFIGLSIILGILALDVGEQNNYLLGFALFLTFIGILSILTRPQGPAVDLGLIVGGILIACAVGTIFYLMPNKQED